MAVERPSGAIRFVFRIKTQRHSRDFTPVSTFRIRVEQAQCDPEVRIPRRVRRPHGS
jgi:hypothetical protein